MGKFDNVDLGNDATMKRMVKHHRENSVSLEWLKDRHMYRVRRTDWPSDAFEVVEHQEFSSIEAMCKKFCIPFNEIED